METTKKKKSSNVHRAWNIILTLTLILAFLASGYSIYHILLLGPIESGIRYILVGIFLLIDIFCFYRVLRVLKRKNKKRTHLLFVLLMVIYIMVNAIIGILIGRVYGSINRMNKEYVTYSTSLITMKDSKLSKVEDVKDQKLGIIDDKNSTEGYVISQEMIKEKKLSEKNDLEEYSDFSSMIAALYEGDVDAIFISSNYAVMFQGIEEYQEIEADTKVIYKKEKRMKKQSSEESIASTPRKKITEPFTILLMGVDSEVDGLDKNGAFNGDALMLVTFNPKTLNATMLSIPRDTYVPISCFKNQIENKITHAAWYGESCMMKTIENFTGIQIDYYAKINFKGVVSLVDALGGIDVDVPQDLCTDDSNRAQEICIKAGYQHLNGEQALVLSRNRKQLSNGDIGRGLNQQIVIQGMINKVKNLRSVNTLLDILNTVSRNMDTNFSTEQILSFYNVAKDIMVRSLGKEDGEVVNMQQLFLQGSGQMIYDEGMKMVLWNYIPNKQSIEDVVKEMKVNLELEKHELIKTFSFSINEPYEKMVIGEGPYSGNSNYALLPDFTGDTQASALKWANANGVKLNFQTKETNAYPNGTVFEQSQPYRKRIDKLTGAVTLTLAKNTSSSNNTQNSKLDCSLEKNSDNKSCLAPDFTKMTKSQAQNWAKDFKNVKVVFEEVSQAVYPDAKLGQIVSQSIKYKNHLKKTTTVTLTIVVKEEVQEPKPDEKEEQKEDEKKEEQPTE